MNILLISSPMISRTFTGTYIPNLGLLSLASNIDKKHNVKILDSFHDENNIDITSIINDFQPSIIGLSSMTFQYQSIRNIAIRIRSLNKKIKIVLGGYHATLLYKEILESKDRDYFDFIIRNEGESAFNKLLSQMEKDSNFKSVPNLSYHINGKIYHNETIESMDLEKINLPDRSLISNNKYIFNNWINNKNEIMVTIETSRGCKHKCKYCSIKLMYSKPYRAYPLTRVIEDIKNIETYQKDVDRIFIIDDNITTDVKRFEQLCDLIIENNLNKFKYVCQCSSIGISSSENLVKKMKKAGFDVVFLGIENNDAANLKFLGKGDIKKNTEIACKYLNKHNIIILGGVMIGCPDDNAKSIKEIFKYLKHLRVYYPAIQYVTPYPKTILRDEYIKQNLIDNLDNFSLYDGGYPNIHTNKITSLELFKISIIEAANNYIFNTLRFKLKKEYSLKYKILNILLNFKQTTMYILWRYSHLLNEDNYFKKQLLIIKENYIQNTNIDKFF